MAYFYSPDIKNDTVTLSREESAHLAKTFRAKVGDSIKLIDGNGSIAQANITDIHPKKVCCEIKNRKEVKEPPLKVHVYLAPPRHNIMSPLVKQCVELGIWSINLIDCEFSVSKPKDKKNAFESEITAGAKQSGNPFFPQVNSICKFSKALEACSYPKYYGAVPEESIPVKSIQKEGDISLWIGPEGGFSSSELKALKQAGAQGITVGNWVLRVETALVSLLGVLNS